MDDSHPALSRGEEREVGEGSNDRIHAYKYTHYAEKQQVSLRNDQLEGAAVMWTVFVGPSRLPVFMLQVIIEERKGVGHDSNVTSRQRHTHTSTQRESTRHGSQKCTYAYIYIYMNRRGHEKRERGKGAHAVLLPVHACV